MLASCFYYHFSHYGLRAHLLLDKRKKEGLSLLLPGFIIPVTLLRNIN